VACGSMRVVSSLLVMAGVVVLGRFAMMLRSMGVVFGCLGVMLCSFLRHLDFLLGQDDPAAFECLSRMSVPVRFDQSRQKSRFGASAV
jgi:hypothetical protein